MKQSKITGWITVTRANPTGPGTLTIHHRQGDERWVHLAISYWKGEIEDLHKVVSSVHAEVQRGAISADGRPYYFKRYFSRDWRDRLKRMIRQSRGHRALVAGELITAQGFLVPRPVCLIEWRHFGITRSSVLITEEVENAHDLYYGLVKPELGIVNDMNERRSLTRTFAGEVARWHACGLHHGDMRLRNVMVRRAGTGFEYIWLDHENTRHFKHLPRTRRIHNLMQLNMTTAGISLTDRMRFWDAYRKTAQLDKDEASKIRRAVATFTRSRWKKHGHL
ncbi:MAG: lipopolysaccharide kinase InaA family protein [Verrucomicrobia bacterium]|nr:lipopolysaccharide kinase InaA family protein [Verrucomicrobiota bacterium]